MRTNTITLADNTIWEEGTKVFTFKLKGAKIIITSHVPNIYQDAPSMKLLDCFSTKELCLKQAEMMAAFHWSRRITDLKNQLKSYQTNYEKLSREARTNAWVIRNSTKI